MQKEKHLLHIDGLRGLAIILIVLFHMDGNMWAHGYLGVDIFLVISGYLLMMKRLCTPPWRFSETFSFVLRRVQRIVFPMLAAILLAVLIGFFLFSNEQEDLACNVGYRACFFRANTFLANRLGDYFAPDSSYMPLLHMWYLSVIFQVYLLFAVGNVVLQRLPRRWLGVVLGLAAFASFALDFSFLAHNALEELGLPVWEQQTPFSYYFTFPRIWEVMAGGWLACLAAPSGSSPRRICLYSLVGCAFILLPALGLLPGCPDEIGKLLCIIGTLLVIRYVPLCSLDRVLSNRVLTWLGVISFSLYLVHMPVIVSLRLWSLGSFSWPYQLTAFVLSIALAWGFWFLVETRKPAFWSVLLLWGGTLLICRQGRKSDGFSDWVKAILHIEEGTSNLPYNEKQSFDDPTTTKRWNPTQSPDDGSSSPSDKNGVPLSLSHIGDKSKPPFFVLMGDSHGEHSYAGLDQAMRKAKLSGVYFKPYTVPFCGITLRQYDTNPGTRRATFEWLRANPHLTHVIIAQRWILRWDGYHWGDKELHAMPTVVDVPYLRNRRYTPDEIQSRERITKALREYLTVLRDMGKKVILIGPTPEFGSALLFNKVLAWRNDPALTETAMNCSREVYLAYNDYVFKVLYQLRDEGLCETIIEPLSTLRPDEGGFPCVSNGKCLMRDGNHLSTYGSIIMMQKLLPSLRAALLKDSPTPAHQAP